MATTEAHKQCLKADRPGDQWRCVVLDSGPLAKIEFTRYGCQGPNVGNNAVSLDQLILWVVLKEIGYLTLYLVAKETDSRGTDKCKPLERCSSLDESFIIVFEVDVLVGKIKAGRHDGGRSLRRKLVGVYWSKV